jgi:hypothetical protein
VGLIGKARGWRRGDLAVHGEGGFEGYEWGSVLNEVGEGFVEIAGLLFEDADGDLDAGGAKFGETLAADLWVGVLRGDDAAADARGDEGIGAGASAAVVAAWFEGDVRRGALGGQSQFRRLFQRHDLGVVAVGVEVGAFADDLSGMRRFVWANQNAAYLRVRRGQAQRLRCELEGSLHMDFVLCLLRKRTLRHCFKDSWFDFVSHRAA